MNMFFLMSISRRTRLSQKSTRYYASELRKLKRQGKLRPGVSLLKDNAPVTNIPSSPAYGLYISQLIRYARACSTYDTFSYSLVYRQFSANFTVVTRSSLPIQPSFRPNAVWFVSYQSLSHPWHTNLEYSSYAYSSQAPDPTSGVSRGPCKPGF
jgi:hypothetical protein